MKDHWNKVYSNSPSENLGWYEENPEPSLQLISKCLLNEDSSILNVGTGTSTLIDELLKIGYRNISATDISSQAVTELKKRLGPELSGRVNWILDDLTNPSKLNTLEPVDLWHDRAVFHFFTKCEDQEDYFKLLKTLVKKGGFVILAAFNLNGAPRCSGLPVCRFDLSMLQEKLGENFLLKENFNYTYKMPSGDTREYIYTLFQRRK
jgi:SAM-dependent methyltransferase